MTPVARALAVGGMSAGTLMYEILLVRVFAIEYFHHFAYMAIGVAMLGFGASGTFLAVLPPLARPTATRWFRVGAVLTAVSLVISPALVHRIALDPTQLAWNWGVWLRLAGVYAVLAVPFALAALVILLALTLEKEHPGWVYGTSLLGSGLGTVLALAILWVAFPARALAVPAAIAAIGSVAAYRATARPVRVAPVVAAVLALAALVQPPWTLAVTPYKGLPQVEAYPEAERLAERTSPLGWVVQVAAPAFRYAPGLSLAYQGGFPPQRALFVDGDIVGATTDWSAARATDVLDWLPTTLPYAAGSPETVLLLGAGGGVEAANALAHGARRLSVVELHPHLVELAAPTTAVPEATGEIDWVVGDARHFVARVGQRFDLIALAPAGGTLGGAAGVHALNEDFLHTVDAYVEYLRRLADGGTLAITRWLDLPPREAVRTILTVAEALRRLGVAEVGRHMVVVRSWATVSLLAKPAGFTPREFAAIASWTTTRLFDVDWPASLGPGTAFNYLEENSLEQAASAAASGPQQAAAFAASYAFEVAPVSDARPYPHHFLRLRSLGSMIGSGGRGSWMPFAEWGQIALFATLAQSIGLAALCMLLPAAVWARRAAPRRRALIGYFTGLGLAYMAAEIAAIQQLSLLLGHPVYAVAAVLGAFLICSGAGSVWSDRLLAVRGKLITAVLALVLLGYAALLLPTVHWLQAGSLAVRVGAAALALGPLAFLMGAPFPTGLRMVTGSDATGVAWAWASNGFASVVAAPLAAVVALKVGSSALFVVAAAGYAASSAAALVGGLGST